MPLCVSISQLIVYHMRPSRGNAHFFSAGELGGCFLGYALVVRCMHSVRVHSTYGQASEIVFHGLSARSYAISRGV